MFKPHETCSGRNGHNDQILLEHILCLNPMRPALQSASFNLINNDKFLNDVSIVKVKKKDNYLEFSHIEDDKEFEIVPLDDIEEEDLEEESVSIPKEDMRISVKSGKSGNKIYDFSELEDGLLLEDTIDALETKNVTIRLWIKHDSNLTSGNNLSYHGIMKVIEENRSVAVNQ